MTKKKKSYRRKQAWYKKWQLWLGAILIFAAGIAFWSWRQMMPAPLPATYQTGIVTYCLRGPAFVAELGLESPAIDTSQLLATGLVIREPYENGRYYQHETWDDAGSVGPFAYDRNGTVYLGPTPLASLQVNPTAEQNWIYQVDSQTAVMSQFLELPWPLPPSGGNPFGVTGLTHDCDTSSLYATSVAGSTAQEEVGSIYQIDLVNGEVVSQLENVDALGAGVYNGIDGKRLYYGLARSPEVHSIALDATTGQFIGESRLEFSLASQPGGSFDNAHRIQFTNDGTMIAKGVEFSYSLQVASDPQRNIYTFAYEPEDDSWRFLNVVQQ